MERFRFRLATLLRIHESTRDERRRQLAEAYRADATLKERIRGLDQRLSELKQYYGRGGMPGMLNVDELIDAERYELLLLAERQQAQQHEVTLAAEIERRRQALVAADREVRVLEKLREQQLGQHRFAEERQASKQMDEVAARIARRAEEDE